MLLSSYLPDMDQSNEQHLSMQEFLRVEMCVGTILEAAFFEEARTPAYKLLIDFGEVIGKRKTSAQITQRYRPEMLINRQVIAVVNFPPKQIATMMSECLVLGAVERAGDVVLLDLDQPVANGTRIA